jgi:mannose-6-phosphate isomerase-like protein (cupin superfamily)
MVSSVIGFKDDQLGSATNGLKIVKEYYPDDEIIFCNGGDRDKDNIPEMDLKNITFKFSVGGDDKKNSSSWILKKWTYPFTKRRWGDFYDLFQDEYVKVKELIVYPKQGMSYQKHFKRNELWLVSKGMCEINFSHGNPSQKETKTLYQGERFDVPVGSWHQITNPFDEVCRIIEIQYGDETIEEDIERLSYYNNLEL